MRVALIADDLTGAMDAAAPFARRGARTRVLPRGADFLAARDGHCDVVSVNTETRHLDAACAARLTREALESLAQCRPEVVFKKIDSTLRGQVVAEIVASLGTGVRRRACVAPAVPSQGRVVRGGGVFVHGVPLARSEVARDARMPAPSRPLEALMREAALEVGVLARDLPLSADGPVPPVVIADCEEDRDFRRLFADGAAQAEWLWVGAAGLGAALAETLWPHPQPAPRAAGAPERAVLFVVGSRTERSGAQVQRLRAAYPVREVFAPAGRVDGVALRAACASAPGGAVLLCATAGSEARAADEVARELGEAAAAEVAGGRVGALFVTGGDTASALLAAAGVRALDLAGEVAPGVAIAIIECAGRTLPLVTKSGGFGSDDVLVDVLAHLRSQR